LVPSVTYPIMILLLMINRVDRFGLELKSISRRRRCNDLQGHAATAPSGYGDRAQKKGRSETLLP
jgi:hypothetical protein